MRLGIGVPNTPRRVVSPTPPVPSGWLLDVMSLPITQGGLGSFETGIYFDVATVQNCVGILVDWQNTIYPTPNLRFDLWNTSVGLIATETLTLASPGLANTTVSFGSHVLTPGNNYCVSVYETSGNAYNGLVFGNPYAIPRAYPKYSVQGSYVYRFGSGVPNNVNNGACALIEPVML